MNNFVSEKIMIDALIRQDLLKIEEAVKPDVFGGKKILVTGGAGFIGSWLCDILVNSGASVTVIDNFSTGQMKNIDHLRSHYDFQIIEADVSNFTFNAKFDFIFHMAAHASPDEYMAHPLETLHTSAFGTQRIAELARKSDSTLLFASTSEVYGDAEVIPTPETYWGKVNPIGPRSCYDEGKRFAEALLMAYHRQYGLDIRVPRIFNSYGPRLREDDLYGRALSRFILQALTNQPITVYGDGKQTRSFCYITDTVTGLLLLAVTSGADGQVVNLGNTTEVSILELAYKIKEITKTKSEIEFSSIPKDDPKRRCPDTAKLTGLVDWKPCVAFNDGLKRAISWFSNKEC
jgi:UDP-glucuronate decarboxylase